VTAVVAEGVTMRLPRRRRLVPPPLARDAEAMRRLAAVSRQLAEQKAELDQIARAIGDGAATKETDHDRHA
jgi:hypothetical protein